MIVFEKNSLERNNASFEHTVWSRHSEIHQNWRQLKMKLRNCTFYRIFCVVLTWESKCSEKFKVYNKGILKQKNFGFQFFKPAEENLEIIFYSEIKICFSFLKKKFTLVIIVDRSIFFNFLKRFLNFRNIFKLFKTWKWFFLFLTSFLNSIHRCEKHSFELILQKKIEKKIIFRSVSWKYESSFHLDLPIYQFPKTLTRKKTTKLMK